MVRHTLEYSIEVWEAKKAQAAALESVSDGGAKRILGFSSRTHEAVKGTWDWILYSAIDIRQSLSGSLVRGTHTNFIVRFGISNHLEVTRRNLGVKYNIVNDLFS